MPLATASHPSIPSFAAVAACAEDLSRQRELPAGVLTVPIVRCALADARLTRTRQMDEDVATLRAYHTSKSALKYVCDYCHKSPITGARYGMRFALANVL